MFPIFVMFHTYVLYVIEDSMSKVHEQVLQLLSGNIHQQDLCYEYVRALDTHDWWSCNAC